jgi:hypothetical protein
MFCGSRLKAKKVESFIFIFTLACVSLLAAPASAQGFCALLPADAVKSTLGITVKLVAKATSETGNNCHYRVPAPGPVTVIADSGDATGMVGTMFDQRLTTLGPDSQLLPGVGEAAYYSQRDNEQIAKFPGITFTQQSIVFRAKGKIISLIVTTAGTGLPKAAIQSLAALALSKPIDTLQDPSN